MTDQVETLPRPPWARATLAYAVGLTMAEFALILVEPRLFQAVIVADAAMGWAVILAGLQGLRAVPFPPAFRWVAVVSIALGHWLAAVFGALTLISRL